MKSKKDKRLCPLVGTWREYQKRRIEWKSICVIKQNKTESKRSGVIQIT